MQTRMKVIGAGLPRTGTMSLKAALEKLLGLPCYHMIDYVTRFDKDRHSWSEALGGRHEVIPELLSGYGAAVDWPAALLWREISEIYPETIVLLSLRSSEDEWWASVSSTIGAADRQEPGTREELEVVSSFRRRAGIGDSWADERRARTAYAQLHSDVMASVPPERLIVWQPSDGWSPICRALALQEPLEPFPHLNQSDSFYHDL